MLTSFTSMVSSLIGGLHHARKVVLFFTTEFKSQSEILDTGIAICLCREKGNIPLVGGQPVSDKKLNVPCDTPLGSNH